MHPPSERVPGRLRLRFTQLKQQTEQLCRMAAALHAVDGVLDVETSPLTGSLLILYDAAIGKTVAFWDQVEAVLVAHQLLLDPRPLGRQQRRSGGGPSQVERPDTPAERNDADDTPLARQRTPSCAPRAGQGRASGRDAGRLSGKLAGGIATALANRLVERSAVVLVAALFR